MGDGLGVIKNPMSHTTHTLHAHKHALFLHWKKMDNAISFDTDARSFFLHKELVMKSKISGNTA
jgi:hypothetical protein